MLLVFTPHRMYSVFSLRSLYEKFRGFFHLSDFTCSNLLLPQHTLMFYKKSDIFLLFLSNILICLLYSLNMPFPSTDEAALCICSGCCGGSGGRRRRSSSVSLQGPAEPICCRGTRSYPAVQHLQRGHQVLSCLCLSLSVSKFSSLFN